MTRIAAKLLVLLAVLIMPLGMATAGASAPASGHDAGMDMAHCPDAAPAGDAEPGIAACNMVCAAALPAIGPRAAEPQAMSELPQPAPVAKVPAGILLETATPPPRIA
jgi:hypothetical protein